MKKTFNCALYVDGEFKDGRSVSAYNKVEAEGNYTDLLDREGIQYDGFEEEIIVRIEVY